MKPFVTFRESIHGKYIFRLCLLEYHLFIMQRVVCKFYFKIGFPGIFKNENSLTFIHSLSFGFKCWCWRVDASLLFDSLWYFSLHRFQDLLFLYGFLILWSPPSSFHPFCWTYFFQCRGSCSSLTSVAFSYIIY